MPRIYGQQVATAKAGKADVCMPEARRSSTKMHQFVRELWTPKHSRNGRLVWYQFRCARCATAGTLLCA